MIHNIVRSGDNDVIRRAAMLPKTMTLRKMSTVSVDHFTYNGETIELDEPVDVVIEMNGWKGWTVSIPDLYVTGFGVTKEEAMNDLSRTIIKMFGRADKMSRGQYGNLFRRYTGMV